jgi:hypothetical protein
VIFTQILAKETLIGHQILPKVCLRPSSLTNFSARTFPTARGSADPTCTTKTSTLIPFFSAVDNFMCSIIPSTISISSRTCRNPPPSTERREKRINVNQQQLGRLADFGSAPKGEFDVDTDVGWDDYSMI